MRDLAESLGLVRSDGGDGVVGGGLGQAMMVLGRQGTLLLQIDGVCELSVGDWCDGGRHNKRFKQSPAGGWNARPSTHGTKVSWWQGRAGARLGTRGAYVPARTMVGLVMATDCFFPFFFLPESVAVARADSMPLPAP